MTEELYEINKEFQRIRAQLWEKKGHICAYCGKPAEELHHIIPRHMGGDNRLQNIIPLCEECHHKAHSKSTGVIRKKRGRPKIQAPTNINDIYSDYIHNDITVDGICNFLGVHRNTLYRWFDEAGLPRKGYGVGGGRRKVVERPDGQFKYNFGGNI